MVLFGAQDLVLNVIEQAAIDQIIPIVATEQQARERLSSIATRHYGRRTADRGIAWTPRSSRSNDATTFP